MMKIHKSLNSISAEDKGAVIAIGNFDGVHRGHQALLNKAKAIAQDKAAPLGVLTFEPHPKRLFRPDDAPSRLTPRALKIWRMEEENIDALISLNFDWDFASQSAEEFIQRILIDALDACHVVVGDDFRFGQLRKGDAGSIEKAGIPVTPFGQVKDQSGEVYSSSRIRKALRDGDIEAANQILGWNWEIRGEVVKGDQRGRGLGYPTANVKLEDTIHPAYGVYAVRVQIEGRDDWLPAATNIGIRPMFEVAIAQVETFIFDFDSEIYGKTLRIQPVKRLRGEAKFNSLEELVSQMDKDCEAAREILI